MEDRGTPADRAEAYEEARAQGAREIAERPERVLELITHRQAVFTRTGHRARNQPLCGRGRGVSGDPGAGYGLAGASAACGRAGQAPGALLHAGDDPGRARYDGRGPAPGAGRSPWRERGM